MTSPQDNASILSGQFSVSPKTIRGTSEHSHSPVRHRASTGSDTDNLSRPRLSPTLTRSFNPNDPDVRERQRTMDADMAMHLSRARSNTLVVSSPISPSPPGKPVELDDPNFPRLSLQEEHSLKFARSGGHHTSADEHGEHYHHGLASEAHLNHLSAAHEPALLVSLGAQEQDDIGGLPLYQASVPLQEQPFDFSTLEAYARDEKRSLGIHSPTTPTPPDGGLPCSQSTTSTVPPLPDIMNANGSTDSNTIFPLPRARQRKLSQSAPRPRRGKMALFEHPSGGPPPTLAFRSPQLATGTTGQALSAVASADNLPSTNGTSGVPQLARQTTMGSGHDRPYRFSFYSNSLSATIHARSLSELPAEGQSFEELFQGTNEKGGRWEGAYLSRPGTSMGLAGPARGAPSIPIAERSGISKMSGNGKDNNHGNGPNNSAEANTWWLDVQSPTDDEMKLLSKVGEPVCGLRIPADSLRGVQHPSPHH